MEGGGSIEIVKLNVLGAIGGRQVLLSKESCKKQTMREVNGKLKKILLSFFACILLVALESLRKYLGSIRLPYR